MKKVLISVVLLLGIAFVLWTMRQRSIGMNEPAETETEAEANAEEGTEPEEELDFSFAVHHKGASPDIIDFVNAILSQEEIGEALGEMEENWKMYLSGQTLPKGRSFAVDKKEGYMRYDVLFPAEEDGTRYSGHTEFRVLDCSDAKKKLVTQNIVELRNGKPFEGQYSGLTFYLYDGDTERMEFEYASNLIDDSYRPEKALVVVHKLPRKGETIECTCHMKSGETKMLYLTWNGRKFDISDN